MMKKTQDLVLLKALNLTVGYPASNQILFEDLELSLFAGQLVCFMGPNGIGKSTLVRTLAGLQKPVRGGITFTDNADAGQTLAMPQHVSIVLTDRITAVNMTVYELVAYGRYPYLSWNIKLQEADKKAIDQAIAQVHIQHLTAKKLYQLSDGQRQMVMIARALAQDTPVILLDEPTAHLDLNNRVEIMKLLRNLSRATNKAILIATHDLELALQTADCIWLTGKNKNIITGIPEDLVLTGAFDEIFQFKGYDLKTGKVQHESTHGLPIQLNGEGYEYRWTKNAFERTGFEVTTKSTQYNVTILKVGDNFQWVINDIKSFPSLQDLLNYFTP